MLYGKYIIFGGGKERVVILWEVVLKMLMFFCFFFQKKLSKRTKISNNYKIQNFILTSKSIY